MQRYYKVKDGVRLFDLFALCLDRLTTKLGHLRRQLGKIFGFFYLFDFLLLLDLQIDTILAVLASTRHQKLLPILHFFLQVKNDGLVF